MYEEDIERIFNDEIRDKKRIGRGIYNRASRRGYTGTIRTQVDYLTGKAKKQYMKGGEIKLSNVFDDINNVPTLEEIEGYDKAKIKSVLSVVKNLHSNVALMKHWGLGSSGTLYKYFYKYGIVERKSGTKPRKEKQIVTTDTKIKKEVAIDMSNSEAIIQDSILFALKEQVEKMRIDQFAILSAGNMHESKEQAGFKIALNGEYEQEEASNRILNMLQTLIKEKKYNIKLEIREIL